MIAAASDQEALVDLLLELGTKPDYISFLGKTAVRNAVEAEHEGVLKMLLAAGADINVASEAGQTALEMAKMRGKEEIVQLLEARDTSMRNSNRSEVKDTAQRKEIVELPPVVTHKLSVLSERAAKRVFCHLNIDTLEGLSQILQLPGQDVRRLLSQVNDILQVRQKEADRNLQDNMPPPPVRIIQPNRPRDLSPRRR